MAAPLRLCEQWAYLFRRRFSPRRKDAKAAKEKRPLLWRQLVCPTFNRRQNPILPTPAPCVTMVLMSLAFCRGEEDVREIVALHRTSASFVEATPYSMLFV